MLEPKETPPAQFQRQCSHPEVSSAWMIEEFLAVRIKASIPLEPVQPDPTGQKKSFPLPLADGTDLTSGAYQHIKAHGGLQTPSVS